MTRINGGELAELLVDEIKLAEEFFHEGVGEMRVELMWGNGANVILAHVMEQRFEIRGSNVPDMQPGFTIDVDEILDIVL